ncbi:MAG TPA: hypothetical protein VGB55_13510, partial [Tepidisphaeraceae bacterium]
MIRQPCFALIFVALLAAAAWGVRPAVGQEGGAATTAPLPATAPATSPATAPAGPEFSLTEFADRATSTAAALRDIETKLANHPLADSAYERLDALSLEIIGRVDENSQLLAPGLSLETLRALEADWTDIRSRILELQKDLAARVDELRSNETRLIELGQSWRRTHEAAKAAAVDQEIIGRIEGLEKDIATTRSHVEGGLAEMWDLQGRGISQDVRAAESQTAVREAQQSAVSRLLEQDSAPLWSPRFRSQAQRNLAEDTLNSFSAQWAATRAYALRQMGGFVWHAVMTAALVALIVWLRGRWESRRGAELEDARNMAVFEMPLAMAIVATVPLIPWFYPQAPRLMMAFVGGVMLVPSVLVLRQLMSRPLLPLLYGIMALYFIGMIIRLTASMETLSRTLLLAQMLAGALFLLWFLRFFSRGAEFQQIAASRAWWWIRNGSYAALGVMALSA